MRQRTNTRVLAVVAGGLSATFLVAGCGPMLTASAGSGSSESTATIAVQPKANSNDASVLAPVVVKAQDGRLTSVTVTGELGNLPGTMGADGRTWTSQAGLELPYGASYQVAAVAVDGEGRVKQTQETFATVDPAQLVKPTASYISDYKVYGVGMPIQLNLDVPVTDKKAVEQRLSLTSSVPVEGAWSWNDAGTKVSFRPKEFWPAGAQVSFKADLYGVKLNDKAYASDDLTLDFSIGDKVVMNVDVNTLQLTVTRNGTPEKTIPVTIGKDGYETHEGIKVIMAKEGTITMKSPPGDPEFYVAPNVEYSMRLTDHGEYFHAAPWASDSFGSYRYSHGCISMTTENAKWLFNASHEGDVVTVFGTGYPSQNENGISVWNESWEQWLSTSATGPITVGPAPAASATPAAPAAPAAG